MSPLDDPAVLTRMELACAGDRASWDALVIDQLGRLRRLAGLLLDPRLASRFDPEDVVQEALADSFRKREKFFACPLPFSSWLRLCLKDRVHRLHRDHLFAQNRSISREVGPSSTALAGLVLDPVARAQDPGSTPSRKAMRSEDCSVLHSVFRRLPGLDREVLSLRYFEGLEYEEIAAILDLKVDAAKKRHERALKLLTSTLRKTHPGWCHAHEPRPPRA